MADTLVSPNVLFPVPAEASLCRFKANALGACFVSLAESAEDRAPVEQGQV